MKCSLCGLLYAERDAERSCRGCLLAGGCGMLRCPNCGYETPRESGFPERFREWRRKAMGTVKIAAPPAGADRMERSRDGGKGRCEAVPLSDMKSGQAGTVERLGAAEDDGTLSKLLALGILPGCRVELLQRFPSFLFRIGSTRIAADRTIASAVHVRVGA